MCPQLGAPVEHTLVKTCQEVVCSCGHVVGPAVMDALGLVGDRAMGLSMQAHVGIGMTRPMFSPLLGLTVRTRVSPKTLVQ